MNFAYFFIIIILSSCNPTSDEMSMIQSTGLTADNLVLNKLLFVSKDIGFIAGSSDKTSNNPNQNSDTFAFLKRTALLYKTTDGGKTWTGKTFGEGSFQNIIQVGTKIFLIKVSEENFYSFLFSSTDFGESWIQEASFPNVVTDIFVIENGLLVIGKNQKGIFQLSASSTAGKTWELLSSPLPIYDAIALNQKLFYLSSDSTSLSRKNLLVQYNLNDHTSKILHLPAEFDCYFLTNFNNQIKFIGITNGHIAAYSLQKDDFIQHDYTCSNESDFFPQGYYTKGNREWIIVGKRQGSYVSNKILRTNDKGKNFETINFKKEDYIKPFYFLTENDQVTAWFYSGLGKFQILE